MSMRRFNVLTCSFRSLMSDILANANMYCLVRSGTGKSLEREGEREGGKEGSS